MSYPSYADRGAPNALVYDIEVVAPDWFDLDERTRDYLIERWAKQELELPTPDHLAGQAALELGLGEIVAIGICPVHAQKGAGALVVAGPEHIPPDVCPATIHCRPDEHALLDTFWKIAAKYRPLVTYNGRGYDGPQVAVRSAILGVHVALDLVPYRYDLERHCDLADVLGFWGARRTIYSLDYWCARFGMEPKDARGDQVRELWRAGKRLEVALYAASDAQRTADLYCKLRDTGLLQHFKGGGKRP